MRGYRARMDARAQHRTARSVHLDESDVRALAIPDTERFAGGRRPLEPPLASPAAREFAGQAAANSILLAEVLTTQPQEAAHGA